MDAKFQAWLARVDSHLLRLIGLTHRDLPDGPLYDWFDDRVTPARAARLLLDEF